MTLSPSALSHHILLFASFSYTLASCTPAATATQPESIAVQFSTASQPWLVDLYNCAGETPIIVKQHAIQYFDPSTDITIRLGEPENLKMPAFEIGNEDIVVVNNPQNPVTKIGLMEIRELFIGQINNWSQLNGPDTPVNVWLYANGDDIQDIFNGALLQGAVVTSLAKLASSPGEMYQAISDDVNAIGILPRRWLAENVHELYMAARVPVLAITNAEQKGTMGAILSCLQEKMQK